jgi:hypothetical protein
MGDVIARRTFETIAIRIVSLHEWYEF